MFKFIIFEDFIKFKTNFYLNLIKIIYYFMQEAILLSFQMCIRHHQEFNVKNLLLTFLDFNLKQFSPKLLILLKKVIIM